MNTLERETADAMQQELAPDQPKENYSIDRQWDIITIREALSSPDIVRALSAIIIEHRNASMKWPVWPTDMVHAAGIVAGEGGELLKAANHHREGRATEGRDSIQMAYIEAIQTGAMALRFLENFGEIDR